MSRALLDTDIYSEVMRERDENVRSRASAYLEREGRFTVSAITVMEIAKGLHKARREDQLRRFLDSLAAVEVLAVGTAEAVEAGRIYAELERSGQVIGRADPMIAAVATIHGLVLVTGNTKHYERIQAFRSTLRLENWRR